MNDASPSAKHMHVPWLQCIGQGWLALLASSICKARQSREAGQS